MLPDKIAPRGSLIVGALYGLNFIGFHINAPVGLKSDAKLTGALG